MAKSNKIFVFVFANIYSDLGLFYPKKILNQKYGFNNPVVNLANTKDSWHLIYS